MDSINTPLNAANNLDPQVNDQVSQDKESLEENQRFTKHSALATLLLMSIGPFSLIFQAIAEVVDMFLITKSFKNRPNSQAVEILGFSGQLNTISNILGLFFGQSLTTRISSLIGSGERQLASHLVSDAIYLCTLSSFIYISIFVFIIIPFLKFLNTPAYMLYPTFKYLIPAIVSIPLTNLANIGYFYLQSIGNSILAGLVKVVSYGLQIGVFSPLFLFVFKVSTTFMKMGNILGSAIVGVGMFVLMYMGKFSLKPKISDIFDKFSPEIMKAILSGIPLLLSFLVMVIPPILILQTMTSTYKDQSKEIGGVFAVFTQIATVNTAIPGAFGQSLLSAGTHAFGSNNMKRLIRLFLWTLLFNGLLSLSVSLIVIPGKSFICKSFLNDPIEIELAEKMLPIPFYTSPLQGIGLTLSILMITVGKPIYSFIPLLSQVIILSAGSKILSLKFKNDVTKIMYIYNISDIFVFVLYLCFCFVPIKVIKDKLKDNNNSSSTIVVDNNNNQLESYKMI